MHETYSTPEQRERLERRRQEVGSEQIAQIEWEWAELSAQVKAKRDAGVPPTDPEVRALAERWGVTHRAHDRGLHRRRPRPHGGPRPDVRGRGSREGLPRTFDADLLEYVTRAQVA